MFEAVKTASGDQAFYLMIMGAALAALIGYRMGWVAPPARRPLGGGTNFSALISPPPITTKLGEPATTQAILDDHKAAQAAVEKRRAQLEAELQTISQRSGAS